MDLDLSVLSEADADFIQNVINRYNKEGKYKQFELDFLSMFYSNILHGNKNEALNEWRAIYEKEFMESGKVEVK